MSTIFRSLNSGSEKDFHYCVVALQALIAAGRDGVGTDTLPRDEIVRFKVPQHLGFPGKALEKVEAPDQADDPYQVYVNFFGLTGPSGVLPRYFSEWVMDNCKQRDYVLRDFLDIFHHRLISLYHRAWEKYQFALQHQRYLRCGLESPIATVLQSIAGTADETQMHFCGLFSNPVRNAQSLKQMISLLAGCRVRVNEHIGRWLAISTEEQTRLASRECIEGQHARLGLGAVVGSKVWDIGSTVAVELHADDEREVQRLLPGGDLLALLQKTADDYLPLQIKVRWVLIARYRDMPVSRLGSMGMTLGRGSALAVSREQMLHYTSIAIA